MKNKDLLGGRPLNPEGAGLLGGYPLSVEAMMIKPRKLVSFLDIDSIDKEIKKRYKDFPAVKSATFYRDGVVNGSNPFYVVAVNEMLSEGRRTATQADLEKILENETLDLNGVFADTALVLRSVDRPNEYLAEKLAMQIRARYPYTPPHAFRVLFCPVMIPLSELELEKDQNSRHGLAFKLKENANVIHAPQLDHNNNRKRFSKTNVDGLPIFDDKGKRILHTRESGLSRLYLSEGNLYSDFNNLNCAGAYGAGRVVIVSNS